MSGKKIIALVVVIIIVASFVGYVSLGGFNEVEVEAVQVNNYRIVGKSFRGLFTDKKLEEIFYDVKEAQASGTVEGDFVIVVYKEPVDRKDTLEQFVGLIVPPDFSSAKVPKEFEEVTLEVDSAVRATITSHNFVMPKPVEVKEKINKYAEEKKIELNPSISIEKYLGDRHLEIEIPLKKS